MTLRTSHPRVMLAVITTAVLLAHAQATGATAQSSVAEDASESVFAIPIKDGLVQRVLYVTPAKPWAVVVMMPGGSGEIGIEGPNDLQHGNNFVVRTRNLWVAQGLAVLIPDAFKDENLRGLRSSRDYADLVNRLLAFARSKANAPVFLLGTSQGAIAAMNGAAHADPGALSGVILSESVSRKGGSHETVFDADPQDVHVPALVVANSDDACDVAPPQDADKIAKAMSAAPDVQILHIAGGTTKSRRSCGSLTPHGYYGIEADVVGKIVKWMRSLKQ